jgi:hypothetical protein
MADSIYWERSEYQSRVDSRADEIESFVAAVLETIDLKAAKASPRQWEVVCRYFGGCARAAKAQGNTPDAGAKRIAAYLAEQFPTHGEPANDGFFEFMDWLNNPTAFRPTSLHRAIEQC